MTGITAHNVVMKIIVDRQIYKIPYLNSLDMFFKYECTPSTTVGRRWGYYNDNSGMANLVISLRGHYHPSKGHIILRRCVLQGHSIPCEFTLSANETVRGKFMVLEYDLQVDRYGFKLMDLKLENNGEVQYEQA